MQQVGAVEHRRARFDASRRLRDQTHQRVTGDGFARAGFADDAQRLALFDVKTHVVDRAHDPVAGVERRCGGFRLRGEA